MQIKQYVAKNVQEALKKVKEEMGPEAIILSTKKIRRGSLGAEITSPPMVEVVAAIDRPSPSPQGCSWWSRSASSLRSETGREFMESEEERFLRNVSSSGLYPRFVQELAEAIRALRKGPPSINLTEAYRGVLNWRLMEHVDVIPPSIEGPKVWAFIGPTGIGKTTTLVKLATHFRLKVTDRVTLITTDTYRIGAVEQLKQYAQILQLPLEVAYRPEELREIIERHRHQEVLLIDTAGRNPLLSKPMEELKDFVTIHPKIESHLLLSATTKESDLEWIVERFRPIPISSYIFTKIDETTHYVPLFNQLLRYKRPLSYLTNGQSVPEDIEPATKSRIAHMVLSTISLN